MKRSFLSLATAIGALTLSQAMAHASWLTINNPPSSNEINLGAGSTHTLSLPGYGGTATVQTISTAGTGTLFLRSYGFYSPSTFSEYATNGLDPNGADQFVIGGFAGANNAISMRFDFTGLTNGYLPAGSVFTVFDLDSLDLERLGNLQASNSSGVLSSPWLQFIRRFDANGSTDGLAVSANDFATFQFISNAYYFTSPRNNSDIPTLYFRTTQDISLVTLYGTAHSGPRGFSVAFGTTDAPEPSSFGLAAVACGAVALHRRRAAKR